MKKIPSYVTKYLWDVSLDKISISGDAEFIIERVLEYGNFDALDWINTTYGKEKIVRVLKKSRRISPKTGGFYALYYDVAKESLECIQKPFIQKQNRF